MLLGVRAAHAGHESPFYPSFYPQEIKIERVEPAGAAAALAGARIHAYVGPDAFAGRALPANIGAAESLERFIVLTFDPRAVPEREKRCAAAAALRPALAKLGGAVRVHPYPVTPFHPDYLHHADRVAALERGAARAAEAWPSLKLRARGPLAERLVPAAQRAADAGADGVVEEIGLEELLAGRRETAGGPPWLKQGWFHAWLLLEPTVADGAAKASAGAAYRQLTGGALGGERERIALERRLVADLVQGCERAVLGFTVRREAFSAEYSVGVENVGFDAHQGLASALFIRTVKLKDFPWNGWLRIGVDASGAAAWNPVAGFGDAVGRLVWAALDDPALLPSPRGSRWIPNRLRAVQLTRGPIEIPADAVLPDAGTGIFRRVGAGRTAAARLTYRVALSAAHDGTRMTAADALDALSFAFRWGAGDRRDPAVAEQTAVLREWLAGVRLLKVDTETKSYGEDLSFTYDVPVIEIYLAHPAGADALGAATIAPPWTAVPWHVTALMEEAVRRGAAAFSAGESRRRGVPWLDLADARQHDRLASLLEELRAGAFVPPALRAVVTAAQARQRWGALKRFAETYGHFLVTAGPYRLVARSPDAVTLAVFRDLSYPLGVGAFDRYAIPLRAYATAVQRRDGALDVAAEVEQVSRFARSYEIVRAPLTAAATEADVPECRYVIVARAGDVVSAGAGRYAGGGHYAIDLRGVPAGATAWLALVVGDNAVQLDIKRVALDGGS